MKAAAAERRTAAPEERVTAGRPRLDRMVSVKDLLGRIVPRNVRAERLREMVRCWSLVVGAARARNSVPYDFVAGVLLVAAKTPHAAQQLNQMKGNVRRALKERWDLDVDEVKVTLGAPSMKPAVSGQRPGRRAPAIEPPEAEVRRFRSQCPPSLTPETAQALAHLRAFFARRFPRP